MMMFWVFVLGLSTWLYVLLDGFDLGIGILFGLTRDEARRRTAPARRGGTGAGVPGLAQGVRLAGDGPAHRPRWHPHGHYGDLPLLRPVGAGVRDRGGVAAAAARRARRDPGTRSLSRGHAHRSNHGGVDAGGAHMRDRCPGRRGR